MIGTVVPVSRVRGKLPVTELARSVCFAIGRGLAWARGVALALTVRQHFNLISVMVPRLGARRDTSRSALPVHVPGLRLAAAAAAGPGRHSG